MAVPFYIKILKILSRDGTKVNAELHGRLDLKKNELVNYKKHPVTTAARTALAATLTAADAGLGVYDTDEKTPYDWDGTTFKKASGSSAFNNTFQINFPNNTSGKPNGTTVNAGDDVATFLEEFLRKATPPVYTAPDATLTSSPAVAAREVGTTLNLTLTATFIKKDGGNFTAVSIEKNGTEISNTQTATDSIILSKTPVVYKATYNYEQGACKPDSLGDIDCTGRISAGSIFKTISHVGLYKIFFDASAAPSKTSIRLAANSRFENAGNVFTLIASNTSTTYWFWLPQGKTLVSVINKDALNQDITSSYVATAQQATDAAGNDVNGTLYVMTVTVPYSNHRHEITIQ